MKWSCGRKERSDSCLGRELLACPQVLLLMWQPLLEQVIREPLRKRDGGEVFANTTADFLDILISLVLVSVLLSYLKLCWLQVIPHCSVGTFCFAEEFLWCLTLLMVSISWFFFFMLHIYNVNVACAYWLAQYPVFP